MEVFVRLVGQQLVKEELRFVSMVSGALSVMIPGPKWTLILSAGNLDTPMQVATSPYNLLR